MMIKRIQGTTRVLGESQGYLGLPVRDISIKDVTTDMIVPAMETAWEPTPAELDRLNRGGNIILRLFGNRHPPVSLEVQEPLS
jgi:hypothetical protein